MCAIVVGTVVAYFAFLPNVAPKVIVLSVNPFTTDEDIPEYMQLGFAADLRDALSRSRDVLVVDFKSSSEIREIEANEFRLLLDQLGSTHFVDGHVQLNDEGDFVIKPRLVNVSQPMWKELWQQDFVSSLEDLQLTRNEIARAIRIELYDYSAMRVPDVQGISESYVMYLSGMRDLLREDTQLAKTKFRGSMEVYDTTVVRVALSYLNVQSEALAHIRSALELDAENPDARALLMQYEFREGGIRSENLAELERLAADFPNSVAVRVLAEVYWALGWYRETEQLLFRWAQLHPKSVLPAIEIAALRFHLMDSDGVEEALSIGELRQPENELTKSVRYTIEMTKFAGTEKNTRIVKQSVAESGETSLESIDDTYYSKCDAVVVWFLTTEQFDAAIDALSCGTRYWVSPPFFWRETDSRWQEFKADPEYVRYVERLGVEEILKTGREPVAIEELFAPRRT